MQEFRISTAKKDLIFIVILVIILFGLYWKTFSYDLIWDDKIYLKQGLLFIEDHSLLDSFKYGYFREQLGMHKADFYYRPLLTASFMLENKLWGLNPATLRLTNLLIYIFALVFLFLFFKSQSDKNYFPEIATTIFALFPLNVDHIVWIVGRGDLLLLLWGILSLYFLDLFIRKGKTLYGFCSSLFFLLGIFSKESVIFFLPVLAVYELVKRKKVFLPVHAINVLCVLFYFTLKNTIIGIKNLNFVFYSGFAENLKVALGSLGYYIRSLFFPISYDMFLPIQDITKYFYYLVGVLAILFFGTLAFRGKKEKDLWVPLTIIVVFIGGHVLMTFTSLYPFKVYSRYMTVPALGLVWIFTAFLCRQKEKIRYGILLLVLVVFVPSIILNALTHKNELSFWERVIKSSPQCGYARFQIATTLHERKNFLAAELNLNKVLSLTIEKETAIAVSLLYADVEYQKAEYEDVLKWMKSIEDFESAPNIQLAPFIKYHINYKKALVDLSKADFVAAETLFKENINRYPNIKESYAELYNLYIGWEQWEKAKEFEPGMKSLFPSFFKGINTAQALADFDAFSPEKRIAFFIRYRNFAKAISLLESTLPLDLGKKLLRAKLTYWSGKAPDGKKLVGEILKNNEGDFKMLNTLGQFYLNDLLQVKEATVYFDRSLAVNKSQPEIIYLDNSLKEQYLKNLVPVWK